MKTDGSVVRQLTHYTAGEQVYNPKWSPDGRLILFDYSIRDGRDIATISPEGGEPSFLLSSAKDERNGVYTPDGATIIYSSDESGIFNLYAYDLKTKGSVQLTNVLGGAFMPSVDAKGDIALADYT